MNRNHDPLCPYRPIRHGHGCTDSNCTPTMYVSGMECQCELIAEVDARARTDEREKAAERVAEIVKTTMLSWPEQVVLAARGEGAYTMEAIVASRGEEP